MNFRLLVQYDGTDFHGWQIQNELRTVQGELTRVLSLLDDRDVQVHGSGRTDAGVHAEGQVVDVEAIGGGRSMPARVIEIGAYRVRKGEIGDEYQTLVNPELPLPRFLSMFTGITDEMLVSAPRFNEIADSWLDFAGDSVLVAHNSDFDVTLLNEEIARVYPGCRMSNAEVCTVKLSRRLSPFLESHNLDALAEHFGFEIPQRHRAAPDALATARVLLRLLDELEICGVQTLADARVFRRLDDKQMELALALDS